MTKKDYFIEYSWKTVYHKCEFCPPSQRPWSFEEQKVLSLEMGFTICEKCFLRGGEND